MSRSFVGMLALLLDLLLVIIMVLLPMGGFSVLSKWFKNRNPTLPAVLKDEGEARSFPAFLERCFLAAVS